MSRIIGLREDEAPPVVQCALCGGDIHLTRSMYREEAGKFYHEEKRRDCWKLHNEGVQPYHE